MSRFGNQSIEKPAAAYPAAASMPTGAATSLPEARAAAAAAPARYPATYDAPRPDPEIPPFFTRPPLPNLAAVGSAPRTSRPTQPQVSGLPMLFKPQAPRGKPFPWIWAVALFVATSAAVFAFLLFGGLQTDGGGIGQALRSVIPNGDLNLRVRTEDDRLRLTWNQRNPAVAAAIDGNLQIFDGQEHREVHLDGRQVADGLVLYRPRTNDVTFRLDVRGQQGTVTGSVRVLDGLGDQQPLDVSAPGSGSANQLSSSRNLSEPVGSKTPGSPAPIRPGAAAGSRLPIIETPSTTPSHAVRPSSVRRSEPFQNAGASPESRASTINGWETSGSKAPAKPRVPPSVTKPVTSSAGFVGPRPLMQVMPNTGAIPSGTIQSRTRVEVQVHIDPAGKVSGAHLAGATVNQTVAVAALAAARQWTFIPATNNGQRVESDHTIVFEFRPQR